MQHDPRCPLADVDRAAADIARFVRGMDASAYAGDALVQAAVERKLGIVGEALNRLHNDHPGVAARIPRLRRIVDFRNFLIDAYDRVEPDRDGHTPGKTCRNCTVPCGPCLSNWVC